jgi:hypothetical protein
MKLRWSFLVLSSAALLVGPAVSADAQIQSIRFGEGSGIRLPTSLRLCAHLSELSGDLRGVCLGRFGLDEKLSTQTQLPIVR